MAIIAAVIAGGVILGTAYMQSQVTGSATTAQQAAANSAAQAQLPVYYQSGTDTVPRMQAGSAVNELTRRVAAGPGVEGTSLPVSGNVQRQTSPISPTGTVREDRPPGVSPSGVAAPPQDAILGPTTFRNAYVPQGYWATSDPQTGEVIIFQIPGTGVPVSGSAQGQTSPDSHTGRKDRPPGVSPSGVAAPPQDAILGPTTFRNAYVPRGYWATSDPQTGEVIIFQIPETGVPGGGVNSLPVSQQKP